MRTAVAGILIGGLAVACTTANRDPRGATALDSLVARAVIDPSRLASLQPEDVEELLRNGKPVRSPDSLEDAWVVQGCTVYLVRGSSLTETPAITLVCPATSQLSATAQAKHWLNLIAPRLAERLPNVRDKGYYRQLQVGSHLWVEVKVQQWQGWRIILGLNDSSKGYTY